ncbi:hypothetical protein OH76DRAFT_537078 [Lentinus brumalis]|uniref:Uncharacterized protein n=1 Tax=Lentinus brumalis TaxID=2498619 RepID=A0A371DAH6_9APHY|nr:hypothetical protein OH76DRAFT_537078 [Polyporus brumalis]
MKSTCGSCARDVCAGCLRTAWQVADRLLVVLSALLIKDLLQDVRGWKACVPGSTKIARHCGCRSTPARVVAIVRARDLRRGPPFSKDGTHRRVVRASVHSERGARGLSGERELAETRSGSAVERGTGSGTAAGESRVGGRWDAGEGELCAGGT